MYGPVRHTLLTQQPPVCYLHACAVRGARQPTHTSHLPILHPSGPTLKQRVTGINRARHAARLNAVRRCRGFTKPVKALPKWDSGFSSYLRPSPVAVRGCQSCSKFEAIAWSVSLTEGNNPCCTSHVTTCDVCNSICMTLRPVGTIPAHRHAPSSLTCALPRRSPRLIAPGSTQGPLLLLQVRPLACKPASTLATPPGHQSAGQQCEVRAQDSYKVPVPLRPHAPPGQRQNPLIPHSSPLPPPPEIAHAASPRTYAPRSQAPATRRAAPGRPSSRRSCIRTMPRAASCSWPWATARWARWPCFGPCSGRNPLPSKTSRYEFMINTL